MTKQEIFKAAHKLAKKYEGNYQARFAYALKQVYKVVNHAKQMKAYDAQLGVYIQPNLSIEGSHRGKRSESYIYNPITGFFRGSAYAAAAVRHIV